MAFFEKNITSIEETNTLSNEILNFVRSTNRDPIKLEGLAGTGKTQCICELVCEMNKLGYTTIIVCNTYDKEQFLSRHKDLAFCSFEVIKVNNEDEIEEEHKRLMDTSKRQYKGVGLFIIDDFDILVPAINRYDFTSRFMRRRNNRSIQIMISSRTNVEYDDTLTEHQYDYESGTFSTKFADDHSERTRREIAVMNSSLSSMDDWEEALRRVDSLTTPPE